MAKSYYLFGGWLRFFQIAFWLNILAAIVAMIVMFTDIFLQSTLKNVLNISVGLCSVIVSGYFYILIIRILKNPSRETPKQISQILFWIALLMLAFLAVQVPVTFWAKDGKWTNGNLYFIRTFLQMAILYVPWILYARASQRVKHYYSIEPVKETETAESNLEEEVSYELVTPADPSGFVWFGVHTHATYRK